MSDSSDDEGLPTENQIFMRELCHTISEVHSAGSFAAFGIIDFFVNPGISVALIGIVRLLLFEEDAKTLVQASQKAPFGKGN